MPNRRKVISLLLPLLSLGIFAAGQLQAEVYRWTDAEGNTVYSDQRQSSDARVTTPGQHTANQYTPPAALTTAAPTAQRQQHNTVLKNSSKPLTTPEEPADVSDLSPAEMTEKQCKEVYQRSCDEVINWKKYALEACGDDPRCKDPDFLDRKYRPRTVEETLAIARRAAIRNNRIEDEIERYLNRRFSPNCSGYAKNYCSAQMRNVSQDSLQAMFSNFCSGLSKTECRRMREQNCLTQMLNQCSDPRNLREFLAQYNHLSPAEKRQIVEKAQAMAIRNGQSPVNYDQLIANLVEILISRAILGL